MSSISKTDDLHESLRHLIAANKAYWKGSSPATEGARWIYVLHTLTTAVLPCVLENIAAKGLQEREHLPIISVVSGKASKFLDSLDEAFDFDQHFHSSYHEFDSNAEKENIDQLAEQISLTTYGNKDKLLGLTYRGIAFGDAIYDDILRRGNDGRRGEVFDCFDISRERYTVFIRNALTVIDKAYKMFEERTPAFLITSEYVFTKGLYASVASALGAKIINTQLKNPDIILQIGPRPHLLQEVKVSDLLKTVMEGCFQNSQQRDADVENFFVLEPLEGTTGPAAAFRDGKKKVFILSHALCDAPRQVCRQSIYRDYNEWFLDTLQIAKDVSDVDWIIKDHPLAACYGQEDYIRAIFEKNKTPNMHWYNKEYSGIKIKEIADCVITCGGDAGIEYWAYGIPTITAANAYYCDWGVSYHFNSRKEYEAVLHHIAELKKPSAESIKSAQMHISAVKNWNVSKDRFTQLFSNFRKKEASIFGADGVYYENNNWKNSRLELFAYEFCEALTELMQKDDLKSSSIYRLENIWDV